MSEEKPAERYQAFISYSHFDKRALEELHANLDHYALSRTIEYWDATKIPPGVKWKEELQKALKSAAIAILLISPAYLASDFITRNELPPLLKAAEEASVPILCIILRECLFQDSNLRVFQSVNPPSNPLNGMSQRQRDAVWVEVARRVKEHLTRRQAEGGSS